MDPVELSNIMEEAAERGARRALERLGLHDDDAGKDIRDLRVLIDGWRHTKQTVTRAAIEWMTIGLLGLLAFGTWMQFQGKK